MGGELERHPYECSVGVVRLGDFATHLSYYRHSLSIACRLFRIFRLFVGEFGQVGETIFIIPPSN